MAQVLLEKITKVYPPDVKAVDAIDLNIADREFVVLVGPSGCGKSTTLRMIAGLEEITEGTIRIGERVVNDIPPKNRDIAMVFQNYALYPHMTVYKNMAFGLRLRNTPKVEIDRKVHEAANILGITELLDRKPKALSGGQRQRVAVGRAIVRDPACFLFDEPLSNLDAKLRVEMRAEIKRLHMNLQTTTVYVTHDQEEAMTLGDRVVVMKDGIIQQCASPLEIYQNPTNRFVASFVGTPPMNFLAGYLSDENGTLFWTEANETEARKVASHGSRNQDQGSAFRGETVDLQPQRIEIPGWAKEALRPEVGNLIVLGARPEAIVDRPKMAVGAALGEFKAQVNVIETLGDKMDLFVSSGCHPHLIARVDSHFGVNANETTSLYLNMDRVHFFKPDEMGENLALEARKAHRATLDPTPTVAAV